MNWSDNTGQVLGLGLQEWEQLYSECLQQEVDVAAVLNGGVLLQGAAWFADEQAAFNRHEVGPDATSSEQPPLPGAPSQRGRSSPGTHPHRLPPQRRALGFDSYAALFNARTTPAHTGINSNTPNSGAAPIDGWYANDGLNNISWRSSTGIIVLEQGQSVSRSPPRRGSPLQHPLPQAEAADILHRGGSPGRVRLFGPGNAFRAVTRGARQRSRSPSPRATPRRAEHGGLACVTVSAAPSSVARTSPHPSTQPPPSPLKHPHPLPLQTLQTQAQRQVDGQIRRGEGWSAIDADCHIDGAVSGIGAKTTQPWLEPSASHMQPAAPFASMLAASTQSHPSPSHQLGGAPPHTRAATAAAVVSHPVPSPPDAMIPAEWFEDVLPPESHGLSSGSSTHGHLFLTPQPSRQRESIHHVQVSHAKQAWVGEGRAGGLPATATTTCSRLGATQPPHTVRRAHPAREQPRQQSPNQQPPHQQPPHQRPHQNHQRSVALLPSTQPVHPVHSGGSKAPKHRSLSVKAVGTEVSESLETVPLKSVGHPQTLQGCTTSGGPIQGNGDMVVGKACKGVPAQLSRQHGLPRPSPSPPRLRQTGRPAARLPLSGQGQSGQAQNGQGQGQILSSSKPGASKRRSQSPAPQLAVTGVGSSGGGSGATASTAAAVGVQGTRGSGEGRQPVRRALGFTAPSPLVRELGSGGAARPCRAAPAPVHAPVATSHFTLPAPCTQSALPDACGASAAGCAGGQGAGAGAAAEGMYDTCDLWREGVQVREQPEGSQQVLQQLHSQQRSLNSNSSSMCSDTWDQGADVVGGLKALVSQLRQMDTDTLEAVHGFAHEFIDGRQHSHPQEFSKVGPGAVKEAVRRLLQDAHADLPDLDASPAPLSPCGSPPTASAATNSALNSAPAPPPSPAPNAIISDSSSRGGGIAGMSGIMDGGVPCISGNDFDNNNGIDNNNDNLSYSGSPGDDWGPCFEASFACALQGGSTVTSSSLLPSTPSMCSPSDRDRHSAPHSAPPHSKRSEGSPRSPRAPESSGMWVMSPRVVTGAGLGGNWSHSRGADVAVWEAGSSPGTRRGQGQGQDSRGVSPWGSTTTITHTAVNTRHNTPSEQMGAIPRTANSRNNFGDGWAAGGGGGDSDDGGGGGAVAPQGDPWPKPWTKAGTELSLPSADSVEEGRRQGPLSPQLLTPPSTSASSSAASSPTTSLSTSPTTSPHTSPRLTHGNALPPGLHPPCRVAPTSMPGYPTQPPSRPAQLTPLNQPVMPSAPAAHPRSSSSLSSSPPHTVLPQPSTTLTPTRQLCTWQPNHLFDPQTLPPETVTLDQLQASHITLTGVEGAGSHIRGHHTPHAGGHRAPSPSPSVSSLSEKLMRMLSEPDMEFQEGLDVGSHHEVWAPTGVGGMVRGVHSRRHSALLAPDAEVAGRDQQESQSMAAMSGRDGADDWAGGLTGSMQLMVREVVSGGGGGGDWCSPAWGRQQGQCEREEEEAGEDGGRGLGGEAKLQSVSELELSEETKGTLHLGAAVAAPPPGAGAEAATTGVTPSVNKLPSAFATQPASGEEAAAETAAPVAAMAVVPVPASAKTTVATAAPTATATMAVEQASSSGQVDVSGVMGEEESDPSYLLVERGASCHHTPHTQSTDTTTRLESGLGLGAAEEGATEGCVGLPAAAPAQGAPCLQHSTVAEGREMEMLSGGAGVLGHTVAAPGSGNGSGSVGGDGGFLLDDGGGLEGDPPTHIVQQQQQQQQVIAHMCDCDCDAATGSPTSTAPPPDELAITIAGPPPPTPSSLLAVVGDGVDSSQVPRPTPRLLLQEPGAHHLPHLSTHPPPEPGAQHHHQQQQPQQLQQQFQQPATTTSPHITAFPAHSAHSASTSSFQVPRLDVEEGNTQGQKVEGGEDGAQHLPAPGPMHTHTLPKTTGQGPLDNDNGADTVGNSSGGSNSGNSGGHNNGSIKNSSGSSKSSGSSGSGSEQGVSGRVHQGLAATNHMGNFPTACGGGVDEDGNVPLTTHMGEDPNSRGCCCPTHTATETEDAAETDSPAETDNCSEDSAPNTTSQPPPHLPQPGAGQGQSQESRGRSAALVSVSDWVHEHMGGGGGGETPQIAPPAHPPHLPSPPLNDSMPPPADTMGAGARNTPPTILPTTLPTTLPAALPTILPAAQPPTPQVPGSTPPATNVVGPGPAASTNVDTLSPSDAALAEPLSPNQGGGGGGGGSTIGGGGGGSMELRAIEPVLAELRAIKAALPPSAVASFVASAGAAGGGDGGVRREVREVEGKVVRLAALLVQLWDFADDIATRRGGGDAVVAKLRQLHRDLAQWAAPLLQALGFARPQQGTQQQQQQHNQQQQPQHKPVAMTAQPESVSTGPSSDDFCFSPTPKPAPRPALLTTPSAPAPLTTMAHKTQVRHTATVVATTAPTVPGASSTLISPPTSPTPHPAAGTGRPGVGAGSGASAGVSVPALSPPDCGPGIGSHRLLRLGGGEGGEDLAAAVEAWQVQAQQQRQGRQQKQQSGVGGAGAGAKGFATRGITVIGGVIGDIAPPSQPHAGINGIRDDVGVSDDVKGVVGGRLSSGDEAEHMEAAAVRLFALVSAPILHGSNNKLREEEMERRRERGRKGRDKGGGIKAAIGSLFKPGVSKGRRATRGDEV